MEIALSAIAAIGSAFGGATAAAIPASAAGASLAIEGAGAALASGGAAAAGGLSSLFGGLGTASSILSGGASVLGAMRSMAAGDERAAEMETRALDDRLQGSQRRARFAREAIDLVGGNDVAAAAAGLDLSYGQAADARGRVLEDVTREAGYDRQQEDVRGMGYRRAARRARSSGQLQGFLSLAEGGLGLAGRY